MSAQRLATVGRLLLGVVFLAGCTAAPLTLPVPANVPQVAVGGPTAIHEPSASPAPSLTPRSPRPPRLLSHAPEKGAEQRVDEPIELRFDQAMDHASVEGAFAITPQIDGVLTWVDDATVQFASPGFQRDTLYRVTVDNSAESARGLALEEAAAFRFRTVGHLQVATVFPAEGSTDVGTTSAIRVIFNRPVVPLTPIDQQADLPEPLAFSPTISGTGAWINTSIYSFQPSERLLPGTLYTARVLSGLQDTTGAELAEDHTWTFTTELPTVVSARPGHKAEHVSPYVPIRVVFSQAMGHSETQDRFSVRERGTTTSLPGLFSWDDSVLSFKPTSSLVRGTTYQVRLEQGSPSLAGEARIAKTYAWTFTVGAEPRVTAVSPRDGQTMVSHGEGLGISFSIPISRETFLDGFSITPTAKVYVYWRDAGTVARVSTFLKPSTAYTVTLSTAITGRYGTPIAEPLTFTFSTRPEDPMVDLQVPGPIGTYSSYSQPTVYLAYRNITRLDMSLYAVSEEEFVSLNKEGGWSQWGKLEPDPNDLVWQETDPVHAPLNETVRISRTLTLPTGQPLPAGIYLLVVRAPETRNPRRHLVVVSPMNLTLKSAQGQVLVWATDLKTGLPVPGADIEVYDASGRRVASMATDSDGVAASDIPSQDPWSPLIVLASHQAGGGAVLRHWSQGISSWEFGLPTAAVADPYRVHLYTERGVYRPGQTVHFKGILRLDDDGQYSLPPEGMAVQAEVTDSQGRTIWESTLRTNAMGTVYGDIALDEDAAIGRYQVKLSSADQAASAGFQVAEYRKPEFQVAVSATQDDYVQGDTIRATAEASYFFGGPLQEAHVQWRVRRRPDSFNRWRGTGYHSFHDNVRDGFIPYIGSFGELVAEGEGRSDAQGQFTFQLPADIAEQAQSQAFTVEASVTDLNNQEVSARVSVIVHKGSFYAGLRPERYVGLAGKEMGIRAISVDTKGITVTQQTLDVVFYRHEWYSVKERADDGHYYWTNKVRDTAVSTTTIATDNLGRASAKFVPPEGGTYKVLARGLDEYENEVRSSLLIWVSGSSYINWRQRNDDRMELIADKITYAPGEIAEILIPSPYQGAVTALLTIERGGILEYRAIELEGNSEVLSLPVLPEYAPNVFVSVVIAKGGGEEGGLPSFKVGYVMLSVSTEEKELRIEITPDLDTHYAPRETATFSIAVTDHLGRGVPAELSVQLVDLSVESLSEPAGRDIVGSFYRERGLGVATAATLALSVDRHNLELPAAGKGGGGGGGDGGVVRQFFPDTALWAAVVQTDATGNAEVSVVLPDSLTTWRLTVQAVTSDTQVGVAQADVVTALDLMVRPVVPRFMVIGDEPVLGAIVHNGTARDLDTTIRLQAEGVDVERGERDVLIPAYGRARIGWPSVVGAVDEATLKFSAVSGRLSDAVLLRLPVYHVSTLEVVGTAGQVEGRRVESIRLPDEIDASLGELTVQLEPSLAASMREGLDYLRAYPYDCIEQTVSRFLPNVVSYRALGALGVQSAELAARLPQQVGVALQRLYALQNLDGGWGWWQRDASSPELTAYVLLGLSAARESQFAVDRGVVERAVAYLYRWLDGDHALTSTYLDRRATVLFALAEAGDGDLGRLVTLFEQRATMSLYAKAYLAMGLQRLHPEETTRPTTLVNELVADAIPSATGAHWEESLPGRWAMNTDIRTTAIVLRALSRIQPESGLLPNVVRWLMTARRSGRWETTQENVWSILALTDYMVGTGELLAVYDYTLVVNDEEIVSGAATPETVGDPVRAEVAISDLRMGEDNVVVIERRVDAGVEGTDSGKLYYSAFLRYFLPADQVRALSRGIYVDRHYVRFDESEEVVTRARVSDVLEARITLIAPNSLYFVVLEDPLPAGCEAIDTSLDTSRASNGPTLSRESAWDSWYRHWPSHTEIRDEKVALFANYLRAGTYEYTYLIRCTTPGTYKVMPARAYEMYSADVFGRSAGGEFTVEDAQ